MDLARCPQRPRPTGERRPGKIHSLAVSPLFYLDASVQDDQGVPF